MPKPIVLHLGSEVQHHLDLYHDTFLDRFEVIHNDKPDRASFMDALRNNTFGHFSAILKPWVENGVEMGQWDFELISLLPSSMQIFAAGGAGFDWADVDALGQRGIWYANGAGAGDEATSDTTLWMILSVFRDFTKSQIAARTADPEIFDRVHNEIAHTARNPGGHVLGLVGLGNISRRVAYKAKIALGMEVHYYDVLRQDEEEERLGIVFHPSLESLLAVSDCVSLHTPLNQLTRNLMNKSTFAAMKQGARLINTSRGQVVDEEALIAALESGKLTAAGIDVHYHEPQVSPILAAMENMTLTTHVGGGSLETQMNFQLNAMQNILAVVGSDGKRIGEPKTPVNADMVRASLARE